MKHGRNLDDIISEAIHDAIVTMDDLTDRFVVNLRHAASRARIVLESFHSRQDPLHNEIGVVRRVLGHMNTYRFDVLNRLGRR